MSVFEGSVGAVPAGTFFLDVAYVSRRGTARQIREDQVAVKYHHGRFTTVAVIDGTNGAGCQSPATNGDSPGLMAAKTVRRCLWVNTLGEINFHHINTSLFKAHCQGYATMTALTFHRTEKYVILSHLGDSCCFRFRPGARLVQESQTMRGAEGDLTVCFGRFHSTELRKLVERKKIPLQLDSIFVLCSDGLTEGIHPDRLEKILQDRRKSSSIEIAQRLVYLAQTADGGDDASIVVIRVLPRLFNSFPWYSVLQMPPPSMPREKSTFSRRICAALSAVGSAFCSRREE